MTQVSLFTLSHAVKSRQVSEVCVDVNRHSRHQTQGGRSLWVQFVNKHINGYDGVKPAPSGWLPHGGHAHRGSHRVAIPGERGERGGHD